MSGPAAGITVSSDATPNPERLAELVDEQAALRRIATLVARGVPAAEIFGAVTQEVHRLLQADRTALHRIDPDGMITVLALAGARSQIYRVGQRWHPRAQGWPAHENVLSGRPARIDAYTPTGTRLDDLVAAERVVAGAVGPIVLLGRTWGAISVGWRSGPLPAGTEHRLADFGELVATAIANTEGRAQLLASRERIVAAADEARRHIQRNLHDGAQQRVVTAAIKLKMLAASDAARAAGIAPDLLEVLTDVKDALEGLREISHGLHPAALSGGGLQPALTALARRSPIPAALDLRVTGRLAEPVEITAYYLVAETLTNTAKHANASAVQVSAETSDGALRVCVRDDGVGGADPARGSGLVGLTDRVAALRGTMTIDSPEGGGTALVATLPLSETHATAPDARV